MSGGRDPSASPPAARARPVGRWNVANALTFLRLVLVVPFGALLLAAGEDGRTAGVTAVVAAGLFAVAAATDRWDGHLARSRGLVTDLGAVMDPVADKALIGTALVGLSVVGEVPWLVTAVVLVREVGVTALRMWVLRHGVIPASRGGKAKTALQSLALLLLVAPLGGVAQAAAFVALAVAVLVTLVTGADYVSRALALRRSATSGSADPGAASGSAASGSAAPRVR